MAQLGPGTTIDGYFVPYMMENPPEVTLTTTSLTQIFTVTPAVGGAYNLSIYIRVLTGTPNLIVTLTYTDDSGTLQTFTSTYSSLSGNGPLVPYYFENKANTAITLSCTASVASAIAVKAGLEVKG